MQVVRQASEGVFVPLTVGGGIKEFTDADGKHWSALEVASEYFRSGADKVSIGGDAVVAAEEYRRTGQKTGTSSIEQISWVSPKQLSCLLLRVCSNLDRPGLSNFDLQYRLHLVADSSIQLDLPCVNAIPESACVKEEAHTDNSC